MNRNGQLKKDLVYRQLCTLITSGRLRAGSKLPSEVALAEELQVSRVTLRSAIKQLKAEGYINQARGRGTFVAESQQPSAAPALTNGTIMVVHAPATGIEEPWRYITPAVSRIAHQYNYDVTVTTNEALGMFEAGEIRDSVIKDNIIGIIAIMNNFLGDEPIVEKMKAAEVPVILAHGKAKDSEITGFPAIVVDEKQAWESAIIHLSEQGVKRTAVLGLQVTTVPFRGYSLEETKQLIIDNGMSIDGNLIKKVAMNYNEIRQTVESFLSLPQVPDAILCFSDFMAVFVYRVLKELGLQIPDDIAVMGICGYPDAQRLSPSLSTVDFEYTEIARMAVEMVMEPERWYTSDGKGKIRHKQFSLQVRQSTRQPVNKEVQIRKLYQESSLDNVMYA